MNRLVCSLLIGLAASCTACAQSSAKPASQTVSGCVAEIPKVPGKYVLTTADRCMLLSGSFDAAKIADKEITVSGLVVESDGRNPLTIEIRATQRIGSACTRTCTLEPPGTRGVHGKERPGTEGGTPGLHPTPGPQN